MIEGMVEDRKTNIINYLSIEMLLDMMKDQVEIVSSDRTVDYLESFDTKYAFLLDELSEEDEAISELNQLRNNCYTSLFTYICEKFGIEVNFLYSLLDEERFFYIKSMYRFFILDIKETLINYLYQTIIIESKNIISQYKSTTNVKEIGYMILKKELSKENSILIYNVENYLEFLEISGIEDFIEDTLKNSELELYEINMRDMFIKNIGVDYINCNLSILNQVIKDLLKDNSGVIFSVTGLLVEYYKEVEKSKKKTV